MDAIIRKVENAHSDIVNLIPEKDNFGDLLFGKPGAKTCAEFGFLISALKKSFEAPVYDKQTINSEVWTEDIEAIQELVQAGKKLDELQKIVGEKCIDSVWEMDWLETRASIAGYGQSLIRIFNGGYRASLARLCSILKDPTSFPKKYDDRIALADSIINGQTLRKEISQQDELGRNAFGNFWDGLKTDWEARGAFVDWISGIEDLKLRSAVREILQETGDKDDYIKAVNSSSDALASFERSIKALLSFLNLDFSCYSDKESFEIHSILKLQKILEGWLSQQEELRTWILFWARTRQAVELGLEELIEQLLEGNLPAAEILDTFLRSYFRELYDFTLECRPELKIFDGESHTRLVEAFRKADRERIKIAIFETLLAHHNAMPMADGALGALGILRGEMAKQRRHMAIRKLMARAGSAIQAIKPVFMMSPLSVAQFLEPGKINFDLVIFDEASQVRPVDALGAISRGKQLVVVGDNKQLPPSSFFSRIDVDDDEDDDDEDAPAAAGDMESILTLASARGLYSRMLRWHYRSRHGSLIAVSNLEFYDNNLFIVPSPRNRDRELGLGFNHVKDGIFDRGRSRRNKIEARAVANAALEHAKNNPRLSLGIAAFSVAQRDAIIDELELLRREHPETEKFFTTLNEHEPFFVKNLENVQGDERDVIFISVGYGRDRSDAMPYMNFGPINKEGGERRLNVLISRAKSRCEVFSSITADEINLERSSKPGVKALKTFLNYAEKDILGVPDSSTGRDMDSPFEAAVKKALEAEGYTVHPQVGVAGFFIDLAVVDPRESGRYILGIECDGASYHSARSARERDRQREAVLNDHGWVIHRIWSTDWFEQPNKQIGKVIQKIEQRLALFPKLDVPESKPAGDEHIVERHDPETEEESYSLAVPYEKAVLNASNKQIHELHPGYLATYVTKVVEFESPIHQYEVITRIRENWGLKRSGKRIQDSVKKAISIALRRNYIQREGDFLLLPGKEVILRDRCKASSPGLKKSEYIPPQEIRKAIVLLAEHNHGIEREELFTSVAPIFGISRTTTDFRNRIGSVADILLREGTLVMKNGFLVLPQRQ